MLTITILIVSPVFHVQEFVQANNLSPTSTGLSLIHCLGSTLDSIATKIALSRDPTVLRYFDRLTRVLLHAGRDKSRCYKICIMCHALLISWHSQHDNEYRLFLIPPTPKLLLSIELAKFGIFYKISKLPLSVLRNIYFAFVYPHSLYSIEIYANTSTFNKLRQKNCRIWSYLEPTAFISKRIFFGEVFQ